MNSLLELNQWVEEIKKLEVNDNNIERLNSFIRTSPEKIADKLNISTNTVITHRKNISQKTGIKSVSGLTIFAVVQQIVSMDDFKD